jgi:hypothetical protein
MKRLLAYLRYVPNLLAGLVAGLAAALVTTLLMALSRYYLGIMPPLKPFQTASRRCWTFRPSSRCSASTVGTTG